MLDAFILLLLVLFPVVIASMIGAVLKKLWPNLAISLIALFSALPFSVFLAMLSFMMIIADKKPPEPCVDCGLGKAIAMAALIYAVIIYPVASVATIWFLRQRRSA